MTFITCFNLAIGSLQNATVNANYNNVVRIFGVIEFSFSFSVSTGCGCSSGVSFPTLSLVLWLIFFLKLD